ncbi:hypothetical protein ACS0TY_003947 [Phlomoides rotata]
MGCSFILPYFRNPFIARRWSPRIFSGAAGTAAAPGRVSPSELGVQINAAIKLISSSIVATSKMVKAIRIHELGGPEVSLSLIFCLISLWNSKWGWRKLFESTVYLKLLDLWNSKWGFYT